ncbi:hypothetical protein GCM10010156_78120 [Planobispora rosea]|uniref:Uncharacterized protein n=1 Tax=Planobispora rosea TaxID=35762 RepID=A0A8J3WHA6_PLARO|nr:hypothetical protein [Planobispora rosea]GGT09986.1 hypothetical protein GCM10010156_78120 [Planobispora rosea]GIH89328.1 hypothetical protein Pro02_77360 [Planobispora rosea]
MRPQPAENKQLPDEPENSPVYGGAHGGVDRSQGGADQYSTQCLEAVLTWLEENPDVLFPLTVRVTGAGLVADAHPEVRPDW